MGAFFSKLKAMFGGPAPFETLESFSRAGVHGLLEGRDEEEKRTFELILSQPYPERRDPSSSYRKRGVGQRVGSSSD